MMVAAVAGNVAGYEIGRQVGEPLRQHDGRILKRKYLDQTSDFFDKHGNMALVLGRFVPFVRTYVTLVAGVTRLPRRRFWLWSVVGAVLWVAIVMLAGYFLGAAFPTLGENIDKAMIVILAFSVIPVGYEWWRNRHSHGHARDRTDEAQTLVAGTVEARRPGRRRPQLTLGPDLHGRRSGAGAHPVELVLGEHRAHLEADVGQRVLRPGAPVDRAHHGLHDGAGLAQRAGGVADRTAGGDDVLHQQHPSGRPRPGPRRACRCRTPWPACARTATAARCAR